jgi:hypothetical protein
MFLVLFFGLGHHILNGRFSDGHCVFDVLTPSAPAMVIMFYDVHILVMVVVFLMFLHMVIMFLMFLLLVLLRWFSCS